MNPEAVTETVNHTDRDHAEFSPSALKYLAKCAGFHGHHTTSAAAEMGTRIHEALEVRDPSALQSEEEVSIYEQLLKDEEEVFELVFGGTDGVTVNREMRLHLELDANTPTFGTADIVAVRDVVALVADYKTGISRIDEVTENWQAKAYALGVLQTFPRVGMVQFAFLVPRANGIMAGTFHRSDEQRLRNEVGDVVRFAEQTRPKWETGEMDIDDVTPSTNCRFCRHEDHCPALGAVAVAIASRLDPELVPPGPIRSSEVENPETMAKLYQVARIVENWVSSIKFKALTMVLEGTNLPGLTLRNMGTPKVVEDNVNIANLATRNYGLTEEEILKAATFSLGNLTDAIKAHAPRGKKGPLADQFISDAMDLGIVVEGKTRYTLSSKED